MTRADIAPLSDAYEESAGEFASTAHRLVYEPLARPLVATVSAFAGSNPDHRVLDVAAGIGAFGQRFPHVVAVDLASNMLAANPGGRKVRADAQRLPFRDESFSIAGCAFGINHVRDPQLVVDEMARVAPVVGVTTWLRPEPPYEPKRIVNEALAAQVGAHRSDAGRTLDRRSDQVGSVAAVKALLTEAGLEPFVKVEEVELPWPGVDAYLGYRLGMPSTPRPSNVEALREAVALRIAALPAAALTWRAAIIVGVGRRTESTIDVVVQDCVAR